MAGVNRLRACAASVRAAVCVLAASTAVMIAGPAAAAPASALATKAPRPAAPRPDDGLKGGGFYLEADSLTQFDAEHRVVAAGSVEARYKGRTLRADELDYRTDTGVVTARGHVKIINGDGTAQFADAMTLDKDLTQGVASAFSTRLAENIKIAAASAHRRSADVTELDHVIFTPCQVCAENGSSRPTWSIRARKVIENHAKQTITFKDAVIQVKGIPVFYFPAFSTADPTAPRKSGFLLPYVTISGSRGFSYEQPYYQVISPSQDLIIAPQINSRVYPFLNLEYRKRFYSGVADIRAGFSVDQNFTSDGDKFGPVTGHVYVLGDGNFQLSPDWQWGFTAERTSDKLLFQKYSTNDVYSDRGGLYAADGGRLISQLDTVRQDQNSYLSIAAVDVQGLRPNDIQSTFPVIAPLIEGRFEPSGAILGGRLRIEGSAVGLTPSESTDGGPGVDSDRATLQANWQASFTFSNGLRVQPFVNARGDLYYLNNLAAPYAPTATIPRGWGTIGANLSYPLIKQTADVTYVLEPLAQIAISPNTIQDPRIPNNDSQVWQFDETNLFEVNTSPGYDLYEGGQKLTLAGRATMIFPDGRTGSFLVGRTLQAESDPAVPASTGLQTALSDWIIGASLSPAKGINLFSRWRLDSSNFSINRWEAGAQFVTSRATGYIAYLQEVDSPTGGPITSLDIHGEVYATSHWGASVYSIVDGGTWRQNSFGVVYRDDCVRVEVLYRRNDTYNGTLGPSSSVVLRLTLATLGNTGYSR